MIEPGQYDDPRLVRLYDVLNPFSADTAFYLELAEVLQPVAVLDFGCGTGLLTSALAQRGSQVTGLDPSATMLAVARERHGGERVRWLCGGADALLAEPPPVAATIDLAVMTGHVAQVFLDDDDWCGTLRAVRSVLRPGAVLAFESRNPTARPWVEWTPELTRRVVDDPAGGRTEVWTEVVDVQGGQVRYEQHVRHQGSKQQVIAAEALRFRSRAELTDSLRQAGFAVTHVFGDWDRSDVTPTSPELIVLATV